MRGGAIAQDPEQTNDDDPCRDQSPSKPGPSKPSASDRMDRRSGRFLSRERKGDNIPALAATSQMLQNRDFFEVRQRALRERSQYIRVGMVDCDRRSLQPLSYDFGYFLHLTQSRFVPPSVGRQLTARAGHTPTALVSPNLRLPEPELPLSSLRTREAGFLAPDYAEYPPAGHEHRLPRLRLPAAATFHL